MCAVDGISYPVEASGSLVIVGKSGSGTPAGPLSILRLIPNPPDPMAGGDTRFGVRQTTEMIEEHRRIDRTAREARR